MDAVTLSMARTMRKADRRRAGIFDVVEDFGARGDGVTMDDAAINAALTACYDLDLETGGGVVLLPPGVYYLAEPVGSPFTEEYARNIALVGIGHRGTGGTWGTTADHVGGAVLKCSDGFAGITGLWENSRIEHLGIDPAGHGGQAIHAHISKSTIHDVEAVRWSGQGFWLNDGTFSDELGFLNRIEHCTVGDTGGVENGAGIQVGYRLIDSWIINNNIESPDDDILLDQSGGPFRIIGNHLNGNRSPKHNIRISGGVRELLIASNIFEGSDEEALKYSGPGYMTTPERQSIVVASNIFRQGVQHGAKPYMGIYGAGGVGFRASGLSVVGNVISSDYEGAEGPTYALYAEHYDEISVVGNTWHQGYQEAAPVGVLDCETVEVVGNGRNAVEVL